MNLGEVFTGKLIKNPLFLAGIFIRFGLLFYFSQGVMTDLFIPFIDAAVKHPLDNPWSHFSPEYFPYGVTVYLILFVPKFLFYSIFGDASLGPQIFSYFGMKLPLLIVDLIFLRFLIRLTGNRVNNILVFYWLNPIVIYITFIHGQLDLISMFFSIVGIYYAGEKNARLSGIFTALAVLSKFHTIIVLPLILAYFWNDDFTKNAVPRILRWLGAFALVMVAGLVPLYLGDRLQYNSIGSPEAFRIFSLSFDLNHHVTIYFGVMVVLFILGRLMLSTRMSPEGLFFGCALLFGSLLAVTHAMPGWYFWVLPFFAVFFAVYNFAPRILILLLISFYFVAMPKILEFPDFLNSLFYGIGFSLLQLNVITILVFIYLMVIAHQAPFGRRMRPMVLGIAGNSGTGKNLLANSLRNLFGVKTTRILEGDDYHKWERGNEKWQDYTHLHPRANHLMNLQEHINSLIHGKLIFQRHYDHSSGKFTEPKALQPTRTLIVQGLHTLYLKKLRGAFDLKVYISPHENIRKAWKIKRDCGERGYALEKVLESMRSREKDTELYVQPQKEVADLVVEYIPIGEFKPEDILKTETIPYKIKLLVWNDSLLETLLETLAGISTMNVDVVDGDDINQIGVVLYGSISARQIKDIADAVVGNQRSITRSRQAPQWEEGYLGLIQLFIMKLLSERV